MSSLLVVDFRIFLTQIPLYDNVIANLKVKDFKLLGEVDGSCLLVINKAQVSRMDIVYSTYVESYYMYLATTGVDVQQVRDLDDDRYLLSWDNTVPELI